MLHDRTSLVATRLVDSYSLLNRMASFRDQFPGRQSFPARIRPHCSGVTSKTCSLCSVSVPVSTPKSIGSRMSSVRSNLPDCDSAVLADYDSPRLADNGEMHVCNRGHPLFPRKVAWERKTECLETPIVRVSIAPAITPGSVVFDAFLGLLSREKATLAHRSDANRQ